MPIIQCPITDCPYATEDVEPAVAAVLLTIHNNTHLVVAGTAPTAPKKRAPPIDQPRISKGCNKVSWNAFQTRWTLFKRGSDLTPDEKIQHLFQCCDEDLGDDILKGHPQAVSGTEGQLLTIIKQLAVTPVAVSVQRSELLSLKQDHDEGIRYSLLELKHGSMEAWKHGSMEAWKHGSMEAWKHGSMEAWKHGSMEAWKGSNVFLFHCML